MNKKWSSKKVKNVQAWLRARWPLLFAAGADSKPLALDIHKEILKFRSENSELSGRVLDEALKRHMRSHGYLYGMIKHSHRYDLQGSKAEVISMEHKKWAATNLRRLQKDAQRIRKANKKSARVVKRNKTQVMQTPVVGKVFNTHEDTSAPAAGSPVIRYKQRRRRTLDRPSEVELAS